MPEQEKCPKCGEPRTHKLLQRFACGSEADSLGGPFWQSDKCRIRDLESRLAAETERCAAICLEIAKECDDPSNDEDPVIMLHLAAERIRKPQTSTTEQPTAGQAFRLPG